MEVCVYRTRYCPSLFAYSTMAGLVNRIRNGIPKPHLHAKGTENVHGQDMWLDNDDVR